MNSISKLTGQPTTLRVGGSTYLCYPLTVADFGKLQAWVDSQTPDPYDVVKTQMDAGRFNFAQQQYLMKLAMDKSVAGKPRIGTPEADAILNTPDGMKEILYLSISKGDPGFTRERSDELHAQMTMSDLANLTKDTDVDTVAHDPKAERPTGKRSGNGTSPRRRKAGGDSIGGS